MLGSRRLIITSRYAIFHPLAYLVKLNIEFSIAYLIKKIAMDISFNDDQFIIPNSFNSAFRCRTQDSNSQSPTRQTISTLNNIFSLDILSPVLAKNAILETEEFRVRGSQ